ncbi:MAG: PspC domain-containing protein [Bacteroidaceae bacterium]|nr:PspC domain-containing protein [Bacteroidaceae bacterium]
MAKLLRSKDKLFGGVCGGVAEYFGWNVRNVRLVWLLLSVVGVGSPVIFYILLWLLLPDSARGKKSYEERMKERLGK